MWRARLMAPPFLRSIASCAPCLARRSQRLFLPAAGLSSEVDARMAAFEASVQDLRSALQRTAGGDDFAAFQAAAQAAARFPHLQARAARALPVAFSVCVIA